MIDTSRLEHILREAGRMAMDRWPGGGNEVERWEKAPGNPVCEADLALDRFLKRELMALLPSAGWLSEETLDDPARLDGGLVWIVDPIDGTRDFLRGRSGWCISVALVSEGRPLLGWLHAPARDENWEARAGRGAFRNGERLSVSSRRELNGARFPSDGLAKVDRLFEPVAKPNSIALRIAMIAAGEADLLATLRWGHEWDVAAACLIAREAGASVSDVLGQVMTFNKRDPRAFGLLVSAPAIHAAAAAHHAQRARSALSKAGC